MIADSIQKFSSFCVPTNEAIGWGRAVWQFTGYKWPTCIQDTLLERTSTAKQEAIRLAHINKKKFDCIWIVDYKNVEVIK